MSNARDWNEHYASDNLPWDSAEPEAQLVELISQRGLKSGRVLEIGCGTGTNSLWLAAQGFDVLGVDIAPLAVERARKKAASASPSLTVKFEQHDFLAGPELAPGSFQLVFDRGCFHVFDDAQEQQTFAARVGKVLAPGGLWLSLLGSTEGPPREMGPPRRSARDVVWAVEPALELLSLTGTEFKGLPHETPPKAWRCLARKREIPAQPSTRFFSDGPS